MYQFETYGPLRDMAIAAVRTEAATSFPAQVALAMWACESNWGLKVTGAFNYWGITRYPEAGPAALCATHEDVTPAALELFRRDERITAVPAKDKAGNVITLPGGKIRYNMQRWFAAYASAEESMASYADFFIDSPSRYKPAWQEYLAYKDVDAFLKAVCAAGYATGDAVTTELTIEHQSNLIHAVEMARSTSLS